jgi:exodeoxyribonuclease VII large subunit
MLPPHSIRLSELTGLIGDTLRASFEGQFFWVVGDVTSHSYKASDERHFFVLAEKGADTHTLVAKVDAVAWKSAADKIRNFERVTGQPFQNGIQVLIAVSVSYSPAYGLKLTLHDIDCNFTIGVLEQQKQDILQRLLAECPDYIRKEGDVYITRNNQLPLRAVIQTIAVIASNNTAGYEDFVHTLRHNPHGYSITIDTYFTPVQGENNAHLIKQTLIDIYNSNKPYDAVAIIRGGGAQTDFLIFENFELGRAAAKFPIPIITGIGHQRDETIVDLMVHSPTKTPTQAAAYIIAHNRQFEENLHYGYNNIVTAVQQQLSQKQQDLLPVIAGIQYHSKRYLQQQTAQLAHFVSLIAMMQPDNLLQLGFAMVKHKGHIVSHLQDVELHDPITVTMRGVEVTATVTAKTTTNGSAFDL